MYIPICRQTALSFSLCFLLPIAFAFAPIPPKTGNSMRVAKKFTGWKCERIRKNLHVRPIHLQAANDDQNDILLYNPITSEPLIRVVKSGDEVTGAEKVRDSFQNIYIAGDYGWGDGFHPSTRLCVEFLSTVLSQDSNKIMLDYGTGSGILGISACKFGCKSVIGIDIDDEAIEDAQQNVVRNRLSEQMKLFHTREVIQDVDGIVFRDEPWMDSLQFDIVVANILVGPLMKLAPVLSLAVKEETGKLCLSGVRNVQIPALEAEYAKFGVQFESVRTGYHENWRVGAEGEGEWAQITATRRKLSPFEKRKLIDEFNDRAVG